MAFKRLVFSDELTSVGSGTYLPLSGGTLTGTSSYGALKIKPTVSYISIIQHDSGSGALDLRSDQTNIKSRDGSEIAYTYNQGNGSVFNEDSADLDFRIESDANTHAFFLEGSTGNVGLGKVSASNKLEIKGDHAGDGFQTFYHNNTNPAWEILAYGTDGGYIFGKNNAGTANIQIRTDGVSYFNGGSLGIGTATPSSYSDHANQLVVAGSSNAGITLVAGTSSASKIHFADGTSGDASYRGYINYTHNDGGASDYFAIGTAGATRMTISSTGNTTFGGNHYYIDGFDTYVNNVHATETWLSSGTPRHQHKGDLIVNGTTTVVGHVAPSVNNAVRLGSNTLKFEHGYFSNTVYAGTFSGGNFTGGTITLTGGATFSGEIYANGGGIRSEQSSTTAYALRLGDLGVANYDFTFPDTSTIQLGVSTSSTKTFKLINAGLGSFNLNVQGNTNVSGVLDVGGRLNVTSLATFSGSIGGRPRFTGDDYGYHMELYQKASGSAQVHYASSSGATLWNHGVNSSNTFFFYSYGLSGMALELASATGNATFSGNVDISRGASDDAYLKFTSSDSGHGITDIIGTTTFGFFDKVAYGHGLRLTGFSNSTGVSPLNIRAVADNGVSNSIPAMEFQSLRGNGSTGTTAIVDAGISFRFKNDSTSLLDLYGNGNATFSGLIQSSRGNATSYLYGSGNSFVLEGGTSTGIILKTPTNIKFSTNSVDRLIIGSDGVSTFSGNVTVNGSSTTPMTISADTDKVFTLSSGIGETGNCPTIQTINTAGSALVNFGIRADNILFATGNAERVRITDTGIGIGGQPRKTFEIYGSGAEAELIYLTSTQSANASNRIRQSHRLLTDSQERTSFSLLSGFNTIADGSRNSIVEFKTSDAGTFGTAMVIDGNSVGIGTTSPSSYEVSADNFVVAGSGNEGITIASGTGNTGSIHFADGTSGADTYRGYVNYNHAENSMRFGTDATERMRINSSGNVAVGGSVFTSGNRDTNAKLHIHGGASIVGYNRLSFDGNGYYVHGYFGLESIDSLPKLKHHANYGHHISNGTGTIVKFGDGGTHLNTTFSGNIAMSGSTSTLHATTSNATMQMGANSGVDAETEIFGSKSIKFKTFNSSYAWVDAISINREGAVTFLSTPAFTDLQSKHTAQYSTTATLSTTAGVGTINVAQENQTGTTLDFKTDGTQRLVLNSTEVYAHRDFKVADGKVIGSKGTLYLDSATNCGIQLRPQGTSKIEVGGDGKMYWNGRLRINTDGQLHWGSAYQQGYLSWDTNEAIIGSLASNSLRIQSGGATAMVLNTSQDIALSNSAFTLGTGSNVARLYYSGGGGSAYSFKFLDTDNTYSNIHAHDITLDGDIVAEAGTFNDNVIVGSTKVLYLNKISHQGSFAMTIGNTNYPVTIQSSYSSFTSDVNIAGDLNLTDYSGSTDNTLMRIALDGANRDIIKLVSDSGKGVLRLYNGANVLGTEIHGNGTSTFSGNVALEFSRGTTLPTTYDVSHANASAPFNNELIIKNTANNESGSFASLFFYAGQQSSTSSLAGVGRITLRKSSASNYVSEMGFWTRKSDGDLNQNMVISSDGNSTFGGDVSTTGNRYMLYDGTTAKGALGKDSWWTAGGSSDDTTLGCYSGDIKMMAGAGTSAVPNVTFNADKTSTFSGSVAINNSQNTLTGSANVLTVNVGATYGTLNLRTEGVNRLYMGSQTGVIAPSKVSLIDTGSGGGGNHKIFFGSADGYYNFFAGMHETNNFAIGSAETDTTPYNNTLVPYLAFEGTTKKATFSGDVDIKSTDASASSNPQLNLRRVSSSVDNNDALGKINFYGQDSIGDATLYADIMGEIETCTHTIEQGNINFRVMENGSMHNIMKLKGNGSYSNIEMSAESLLLKSTHGTDAILKINANTNYDATLRFQENGTTHWSIYNDASDSDKLNIHSNGYLVATFQQDKKVYFQDRVYVSSSVLVTSDIAVKKDITTISNGLDKVSQLRGVNYIDIRDDEQKLGVIAQEVESVLPTVVTTEDIKSVDYNQIIPVLIESIKELKHEVETLKAKIGE